MGGLGGVVSVPSSVIWRRSFQPVRGEVRNGVKAVADELSRQGVVIDHHADVFQLRLPILFNGLVQSPTQQSWVVLCARNTIENRVIGMILFRDKDHMFDLFGYFTRNSRYDR